MCSIIIINSPTNRIEPPIEKSNKWKREERAGGGRGGGRRERRQGGDRGGRRKRKEEGGGRQGPVEMERQ